MLYLKKRRVWLSYLLVLVTLLTILIPGLAEPLKAYAASGPEIKEIEGGFRLANEHFVVEIGKYGEIKTLKIANDTFDTNYVMNETDNPYQVITQNTGEYHEDEPDVVQWHQWMGELMFKTKIEGEDSWETQNTTNSDRVRTIRMEDNKVIVTYTPDGTKENEREISNLKVIETYSLEEDQLRWDITVENTNQEKELTVGDFGLPLPFREYWTYNNGQPAYEGSTLFHSFVGRDSSYIYDTRPQGTNGKFLLMTPDVSTGAGFEYQDHWVYGTEGRVVQEKNWCMNKGRWDNGLNVFYIHSDAVKSGNKGYMESTALTLAPGASKTYTFNFSAPQNEKEMKSILYKENIIDAVAIPGMAFTKDMDAQMYLHTDIPAEDISIEGRCPHDENTRHNGAHTVKDTNYPSGDRPEAVFDRTVTKDGEQYHVYKLNMNCLGQNDLIVKYKLDGGDKETRLQFYIMDNIEEALAAHADFIVNNTQHDAPGQLQDKVFDDWMMDTKSKRNAFFGYWGWGDDWGYVHGEFLAEMNFIHPKANQVQALDEYLDVAIWKNLMQEHQEDYKIHDFLMPQPNTTPLYRGFAYAHIYNTYFSMYKIAHTYPELISYTEDQDTYLLRAYNIMMALYTDGVGFNWATGVMGESSTPEILAALRERGYNEEADALYKIMELKFNNFKNEKYPYVSEYPYDNTSEEAIYTLAKLFGNEKVMKMVDEKTRACRGVQPIWYHYGNPTTICGENYFNFQYTASLAGIAMDDWLNVQNNGMADEAKGEAARINYAGKLANLTTINSGQINSDPANIGTSSWTYQSEMGNYPAMGTGDGEKYNGWRQMSGESDLALWGAIRILSSDVAEDPIFGLLGYGCEVKEEGNSYSIMPKDGLYKRLNLVNEQISVELVQDIYGNAVVSKDGSSIELQGFQNVSGVNHDSTIKLKGSGISNGDYAVSVDGKETGTFTVNREETNLETVINVPIESGVNSIKITKVDGISGDGEIFVDAGEDQKVSLSDAVKSVDIYGLDEKAEALNNKVKMGQLSNECVRLEGKVMDRSQLQDTAQTEWKNTKKPEGAKVTIADKDCAVTGVKMNKPGTYIFQLTANGGTSDEVKIQVGEDEEIPEMIAKYDFEESNTDVAAGKVRSIEKEEGYDGRYDADVKAQPEYENTERSGRAIRMKGRTCGYIRLPDTLTNRLDEATISLDVSASDAQSDDANLFVFSDTKGNKIRVYLSKENELCLGIKNKEEKEKTVSSGTCILPGVWKNAELTLSKDRAAIYLDGSELCKIEQPKLVLGDLGTMQKNYLGRGIKDTDSWLNGSIDNFAMYSKAYDAETIKKMYQPKDADDSISEIPEVSVATTVGEAPELPEKLKVIYKNGVVRYTEVKWDSISPESYAQPGTLNVEGTVAGAEQKAKAIVQVVSGKKQNLAANAEPSGIVDDVDNLGGVKGLNDGYEPANSSDKSHGLWHNWSKDNDKEAWVQYTWTEPVLLTGADAFYYFADGNYLPASVKYQYLDENGNWVDVQNANGLGNAADKYNSTSFNAVHTTAIRMVMTPKTLGCGVIEWKVYGYSEKTIADKAILKKLVTRASAVDPKMISKGMEELNAALEEADKVISDRQAEQDTVDQACIALKQALKSLVPLDDNFAYIAGVSYSYISGWETPSAPQDGIYGEKSNSIKREDGTDIPHYGSWGSKAESETATYTWNYPVTMNSSQVYFWYNDDGGIVFPESYKLEYLTETGKWKEVSNPSGYGLNEHTFNQVTFDEITTTALRLTMKKADDKQDVGVGLVEWQVTGRNAEIIAEKTALQEMIEKAREYNKEDYTEDSWKVLEKTLAWAEAINADKQADQEDVDNALKKLQEGISSLKKAGGEVKPADKDRLKILLAEAQNKEQSDYTQENWSLFEEARQQAMSICENPDAKQSEVDSAADNLKEKMDALVKVKQKEIIDKNASLTSCEGGQGDLEKIHNRKDPSSSNDIDNGVWYLDGDSAWICYEWDKPVILQKSEVYYLDQLSGNENTYLPGNVFYEYLDSEGNWIQVPEDQETLETMDNSMGTSPVAGQYNVTELGNIETTALRMTMEKQSGGAGVGILCWNVLGQEGVDKTGLEAVIQIAEEKAETDYTKVTWESFQEKLKNAKAVYEDSDALQGAVDTAKEELQEAMEQLKKKAELDLDTIQITVQQAESKAQQDYTQESWNAFEEALEEARIIIASALEDSESVTQEQINLANEQLKSAMEGLIKHQEVNRQMLKALLEECNSLKQENYTAESWERFARILENADQVMKQEDADQESINGQVSLLEEAKNQLVLKKADKPDVDKTELNKIIAEAGQLSEDQYTAESWKIFVQVLEEAKEMAESMEASQEEVDGKSKELKEAMKGLKIKGTSLPENNTQSGHSKGDNSSTKPSSTAKSGSTAKSNSTDKSGSASKSANSVKTGDQLPVIEMSILVGISLLTMAIVIIAKKRGRK